MTKGFSEKLNIRVRKQDSAMVYFILEGYPGLSAYSTLPSYPGDPFRVLELLYSKECATELGNLISQLEKESLAVKQAQ